MLTTPKVLHIIIVLSLSIVYSCFIFQLLHPSNMVYGYLTVYYAIFLVYTLKSYTIFHFPPTQPSLHSARVNISHIFKFKLTQERRMEVEEKLKKGGEDKDSLLQQYIKLQKTPSFCDLCENIQPPRAYHCLKCKTCIMGKHFHSQALGFCIGESNQITYLSYLLISAVMSLYSFLSLMGVHLGDSNFQKLQSITVIIYFSMLSFYITMVCYFMSTFFDFFDLLKINKTYTQNLNLILYNLDQSVFEPNPTKTNITYSAIVLDLFTCQDLGAMPAWMNQIDMLTEERDDQ